MLAELYSDAVSPLVLMVGLANIAAIFWLLTRNQRQRHRNARYKILTDAAIYLFKPSLPIITQEIARARRFNREFTIAVLHPLMSTRVKRRQSVQNGQNGFLRTRKAMTPEAFIQCGPVLKAGLRITDIVTYDTKKQRYIIILPETERFDAAATISRLNKSLGTAMADNISISIASFPRDGLIIADLVNHAAPLSAQEPLPDARTPISQEDIAG